MSNFSALKLGELMLKAERETKEHCAEVQGFYNSDTGHHWARDCTKPHGEQIFFQRYDGQRYSGKAMDYEENHTAMMKALSTYKMQIVAEKLSEWANFEEKT